MFQDYALFPNMDVRDNIGYGLMLKGVAKAERYRKVQDAQSLAALGTVQLETASQLSRQMLDDIQKLNTLGQQFKDDLDALAADGIKKSTGKA